MTAAPAGGATPPLKLLVPTDGSENSLRAVEHALALRARGIALEIHLLNVQPALPGSVTDFLPRANVKSFHREEGMKALAGAAARLDAAHAEHHLHIDVGTPAEVIAVYAKDLAVDQIVIGARGLGAAVGLMLGSVTAAVIRLAEQPVTVVK
ncbi:MAG: universal stress protein [Planctomycetes bacterium]|nr:universal stress protein [Planctomycetota bacterium]